MLGSGWLQIKLEARIMSLVINEWNGNMNKRGTVELDTQSFVEISMRSIWKYKYKQTSLLIYNKLSLKNYLTKQELIGLYSLFSQPLIISNWDSFIPG